MDRLRALPAEHAAVRDRLLAVDDRRLPQLPPPRRTLVGEEVARVRAEPADLPLLRHLEALGDGAIGLELGHGFAGRSAEERAEGTGGPRPVKEARPPPGGVPAYARGETERPYEWGSGFEGGTAGGSRRRRGRHPPQRDAYLCVSNITIRLPSVRGGCSTLATSSRRVATSLHCRTPISWCASSRPLKRISSRTLSPRERKSRAISTRMSSMCGSVFGRRRTVLSLVLCCLTLDSCAFLFCSYLNLPKSMILQTGGRTLGATSTRSSPASSAIASACSVGTTPTCFPSWSISRTSRMRSFSLILGPVGVGSERSSGRMA